MDPIILAGPGLQLEPGGQEQEGHIALSTAEKFPSSTPCFHPPGAWVRQGMPGKREMLAGEPRSAHRASEERRAMTESLPYSGGVD